jgi:mannose-6-phosphate isomerase-like protein (cupin superfamily)
MFDVTLKRFDQPDETRNFPKGKFDLVRIGGMTIGRATYEPGWKWSVDIGGPAALTYCTTEHVGLVVTGRAVVAMESGQVVEMTAGDLFYVAPGHDSWVVGNEPYVSLHFMGATEYVREIQRPELRADQ